MDIQEAKKQQQETVKPKTSDELIQELQTETKASADLAAERLKQLQYLQADFDNLQKHFAKAQLETSRFANIQLIKELLIFLDALEQAATLEKSIGINNLYKQLNTILAQYGLKAIDSVGKQFDPYLHEVVAKEASAESEGTILREIQKGYLLNSKVIRHSKVIISGGKDHG